MQSKVGGHELPPSLYRCKTNFAIDTCHREGLGRLFLSDLWQPFTDAVKKDIETLLQDIESSASTQDLSSAITKQADISLTELTAAVRKIVDVAEVKLKERQKEMSRFFKSNLVDGYKTASGERGPRNVKRQKVDHL